MFGESIAPSGRDPAILVESQDPHDIAAENPRALRLLKDMNSVYSYRMPTEEESEDMPDAEGATVIAVRCRRRPLETS